MYKLYYIWLVPAVFCLVYYVCCVAYAGFASSFITIWPVTAVFFAGIFAVRYAQNKGILILPMWINVLSAAGLLILISSFCLVQALITVQMKQKPEPDCEYLLILGCRVRGLEITKSLRYRLDAALAYLEQNEKHSKDNTQNKTIHIIVSGGQGPGEDISEAQAMKDYLCAHGIEASRIFMEAQSTDTEKTLPIRHVLFRIKMRKSGWFPMTFICSVPECLSVRRVFTMSARLRRGQMKYCF